MWRPNEICVTVCHLHMHAGVPAPSHALTHSLYLVESEQERGQLEDEYDEEALYGAVQRPAQSQSARNDRYARSLACRGPIT
jgi:hypothetical protein